MMKNKNQIDIPLVFFFCAFCIVIFGLFSKLTSQTASEDETKKIPLPTQKTINTKPSTALDYNKPITCAYQTQDASISASLEGNSIEASLLKDGVMQRYIVLGDCMYSWIGKEKLGIKKCGIGGYIPMGKQLLSSGLGSMESFGDMIQKSKKASMIDFKAVFESCGNVVGIKKESFILPKDVKFK